MRIDASLPGNIVNLSAGGSSLLDLLARFNNGDFIRAQILEITSGEILLKLLDGTTLKASSHVNLNAKTGDFIDFNVTGKNDRQIFLETVKINNLSVGYENNLVKQLDELNIKPESLKFFIAEELRSANLPISRDMVEKIAGLIKSFDKLDAEKAAFLTAKEIPPSEGNIESLLRIADTRFRIGDRIEKLLDALFIPDNKAFAEEIIGEINAWETKNGINAQNQQNTVENNQGGHELSGGQTKINNTEISGKQLHEAINPSDTGNPSDAGNRIIAEGRDIKGGENTAEDGNTAEKLQPGAAENRNTTVKLQPGMEESAIKTLSSETHNGSGGQLNKAADDEAVIDLKNKDGTVAHEKVEKTVSPEDEALHLQTARRAFDKLYIEPERIKTGDGHEIKKIYVELYSKLEIIKEKLTASALPNRNEMSAAVDGLLNDIRIINHLNNHLIYLQIPINIREYRTTGELYIMKRKGGKRTVDPENTVMLLSLDTENMGQVDSLISVSKKSIVVNFRLEDEKVISFIKENFKSLYASLLDKGYRVVDVRYRLAGEDFTIFNAEKEMARVRMKGNKTIDYRI